MASNRDGATAAILVGVWGTFALDVFSTLNSSPQTTELFADDREDSLMHWVVIGSGTALAGGVYGTVLSKSAWPLLGAAVVTAGMYLAYVHAVHRGKGKAAPASADRPAVGYSGGY